MIIVMFQYYKLFTIHKNSPVGTSDTSTKYLDSFDNLITTSVIDKRVSTCISVFEIV